MVNQAERASLHSDDLFKELFKEDLPANPQDKLRLNYTTAFDRLRSLPQARQEELLLNFFVSSLEGLPEQNKIDLAHFFAKINNIEWFNNQDGTPIANLQTGTDEFYRRLNASPHDITISTSPQRFQNSLKNKDVNSDRYWSEISKADGELYTAGTRESRLFYIHRDQLRYMAFHAVHESARRNITELGLDEGWAQLSNHAAWDAQSATSWIIAQDIMAKHESQPGQYYDKGNPYEVLFDEVWSKGFGFVEDENRQPLILAPIVRPTNQQL